MPRIFDNIELSLLPALRETLELSHRADFCVGYFNLRGWRGLASAVDKWSGGDGNCCRLLIGMQKAPEEEFRDMMRTATTGDGMDNARALRLKQKLAAELRDQLTVGYQTDGDEAGLRKLARQIRAEGVVVKLFLSHPLHAKLYLLFRSDPISPIVGYLGSSNLTLAGLQNQGELNVDVLDGDAARKLAQWFQDRWEDRWAIDISEELAKIIEESWARLDPVPPYHIYLKMAWHLSQEARAGLSEFRIPAVFGNRLFEYQTAAVKIAARHLHKRNGVLIGDVVGLGKTLMATALARMFEDDFGFETLIICPKNLVRMWDDYREQYGLRGRVLSITRSARELPDLKRYRLVLLDESHNLRNREGSTYRAIREYIEKNDSKCILLSATPYNKTYIDLSNQLRLFVPEERDLGIRPERLLRQLGETEFARLHQCSPRSLAAFEKSDFPDDWRELMRLYLVRRTRSFIVDNYANVECAKCQGLIKATGERCEACGADRPAGGRRFLVYEDGTRSYFPSRTPKTVKFHVDEQYAGLYAADVVNTINHLTLPRYGLGNYEDAKPAEPPTRDEAKVLQDLSRAGYRLMGFCRTNLFKRLESSGYAFLLSVQRHILRNFIYLYAIESGQPLPIGTQDVEMLDSRFTDEDDDDSGQGDFEDEPNGSGGDNGGDRWLLTADDFRRRAAEVYAGLAGQYNRRFRWLSAGLFQTALARDLLADSLALIKVLSKCPKWDSGKDGKLAALLELIHDTHPNEKLLIFSQFADTVRYVEAELKRRGVGSMAGVTGQSSDPTTYAWRFSPESNNKRDRFSPHEDLRILVATDVLSEGQNLQDAHVVVNIDLPWAIIRLVQRAGRVDRIGQKADSILCHSFLPADGVNNIIRVRDRLRQRLKENAEVVGTDEAFFEDDNNQVIVDLYNEKAGILDGDIDNEVDLASYAYQIWKNAIAADPSLQKLIPELPNVVYSTRPHEPTSERPEGVLVYMQAGDGNDALAWMDKDGSSVTESQYAILRAAECAADTPAAQRLDNHHDLVRQGVEVIVKEERNVGGQLGRPSGARFRTYERLQRYASQLRGNLFGTTDDAAELERAIQEIYRYPLTQGATDALNAHLRSEVSDEMLAQLVVVLRRDNRLCVVSDENEAGDPRIICSLGLAAVK